MGAPFVVGSDTSEAAAHSIESNLGRLESLVLSHICKQQATDDELEVLTGLTHQSCSARRRGLVLKGRIRDSGKRRRTRSEGSTPTPQQGSIPQQGSTPTPQQQQLVPGTPVQFQNRYKTVLGFVKEVLPGGSVLVLGLEKDLENPLLPVPCRWAVLTRDLTILIPTPK